jgi:hypothetical protein
MSINSKTVRAVLRNRKLRKSLLHDNGLNEDDYKNYDLLDEEKRDIAFDSLINALEAYAPFQECYPSPVEQFPDDVWVYGTRGIYMVRTQEGINFYTTKRAALQYASALSKVSWKLAREMGYLDEQD